MKYKPPIEIWESPINTMMEEIHKCYKDDLENKILSVIRSYNITVDRDELIKALQYDRKQYENGYRAGRAEAVKEFAERLCEGRVSNDPVVIAVKAELKGMVGEPNETE